MTIFKYIENTIIDNLLDARGSIKIASAWFTNRNISNTLLSLAAKGVKIEVLVIEDRTNQSSFALKQLMQSKNCTVMALKRNADGGIMHHKFSIIDNEKVLTGTYNYTVSANFNDEEIHLKTGADVERYVLKFDELKAKYNEQFNVTNGAYSDFKIHSDFTGRIRQAFFEACDKLDISEASQIGLSMLPEIIKANSLTNSEISEAAAYVILCRLKVNLLVEFSEVERQSLKSCGPEKVMDIMKKCKFLAESKQVFLKANQNDFISV